MDGQVNSIMRCSTARRQLSAYLDGVLPQDERRAVTQHVDRCRHCSTRLEQIGQVRSRLKALPEPQAPADLRTALRVTASRERARRFARLVWRDKVRLHLDNFMRPLALPFAGGLVSALFLFSMLVPSYPFPERDDGRDVPTILYTEATVKSMAPFGIGTDEVVVDLVIDEQGRVVDYAFPSGSNETNLALSRAVANNLLFTRFTPATTFGQPTSGRIRLSFRHSYIDVKG